MQNNSLLIKVTIDKTDYQKLANSNGNTFSFIPHVCYFSYQPSIASETREFNNTLLYQNEGRGTSLKNINITVFQISS